MASEPQDCPPSTSLEERQFFAEELHRQKELEFREREVLIAERADARAKWFNPVSIGLLVAAIGLLGNMFVTYFNNRSQKEIELIRLQSNVILESLRTGNPTGACTNLQLFLQLGVIQDNSSGKIANCSSDVNFPYLPVSQDVLNSYVRKVKHEVDLDAEKITLHPIENSDYATMIRYFPSDGCLEITTFEKATKKESTRDVCPPVSSKATNP